MASPFLGWGARDFPVIESLMERARLHRTEVARSAPARSTRTRVSNHHELLPGVDGRTLVARRFRDLCANFISDQGGADQISEARLHLVRRLSAITAMIEELEAKYVRGESIDMDGYLSMVNTATRLSNTVGLNRKSKQVPDLDAYLRNRRPTAIEHDDAEDDDD